MDGTPISEYKLFLRTVQASAFKSVIESLEKFVNDINMEFRSDCVKFADLGRDAFAFAHVKLVGSKFEQYYCPRPKDGETNEDIPLICGVNIPKFYKIIKTIQSTNMLTMYISNAEPNILYVNIAGSDGAQNKNFAIRMLDIPENVYQFPSFIIPSVIRMSSTDFQKLCRDLNAFSDKVEFVMSHDSLELHCASDWVAPSVKITDPTGRSQVKGLCDIPGAGKRKRKNSVQEGPSSAAAAAPTATEGEEVVVHAAPPAPYVTPARRRKGDNAYCAKFKQHPLQTSDHLTVACDSTTTEGEAAMVEAADVSNSKRGVYNLKYLCFFSRCNNFCPDVEMSILPTGALILIYSASLGEVKFMLSSNPENQSS
jgi:proliferating cell nuclear antigen